MSIDLLEIGEEDHDSRAEALAVEVPQTRPPVATRAVDFEPASATPLTTRVGRWLFCTALNARRRWRRALRLVRRESLLAHRAVTAVAWKWYRWKFRFARVKFLRQIQFLLRDRIGGRHATLDRERLLLGGWNGLSGYRFAMLAGDPLDTSTRVDRSFYEDLLADFDRDGEQSLVDARVQESGYFQRISAVAQLTGHYRGQTDVAGLTAVTREFVARHRGLPVPYRPGRSRPGTLPRVRAIAHSDCFQVLDGHHRLARSMHLGEDRLDVVVAPGTTTTCAQHLLLEMSWLDGSRRLYQPVDFPEVQTWPLMRKCTDRLQLIRDHLTAKRLLAERERGSKRPSYLDVGACYGWFVAQLGQLGFDARGIEMDPLALQLGPLAYGLDPAQLAIGDCIELLGDESRTADVVSCFSVLHHFVMGRGTASAAELMRLLDARTGEVLFLDTGQAHESWFRWTLPEWTPEYIAAWIRAHSSFTRVQALGVDTDGADFFSGKFGRTLFACSRG